MIERIKEDALILCDSAFRTLALVRQNCLTSESSVWRALRCKTQSHRESMRPLWFFHLYMLSSATTALSTFCQGRLYPHIYIYICLLLQKSRSSWLWELRHYMGMMLCTQQNISLLICQWQMHEWLIECKTSFQYSYHETYQFLRCHEETFS